MDRVFLSEQQALKFFSDFYDGEHHIPKPLKRFGSTGWCVHHDRGELATFDYNELTRLVVMAHDSCIRVGVEAIRNNILRIAIWKRETSGSFSERHPQLEDHVKEIRDRLYKK
jgi:hypothetical protein